MHLQLQPAAVGVHQSVPLSPLDLLAGVVSTRATGFGGLDALGVDHTGSRAGLAAGTSPSSITR